MFPLEQAYLHGADCNGRRTDYTLELFYTLLRRDDDRVKLLARLWLRQLDVLISHMPVTTWPQCYIASDSPSEQLQSTPQHVPFQSGDRKHGQVAATSDTVPQSPVGEELRCPRPPGSPAAFAVLRGQQVGPNAVDRLHTNSTHEFATGLALRRCISQLLDVEIVAATREVASIPSTQKKGTSQGTSHGAGSQTSKTIQTSRAAGTRLAYQLFCHAVQRAPMELSTAAMS